MFRVHIFTYDIYQYDTTNALHQYMYNSNVRINNTIAHMHVWPE